MDQVDFNLATDTLYILEKLLKNNPIKPSKPVDPLHVRDYFHFSDLTPGIIVTENFQHIPERFYICLMFKINLVQLKSYYKQNRTDSACLTFLSFKSPEKESQPVFINTY